MSLLHRPQAASRQGVGPSQSGPGSAVRSPTQAPRRALVSLLFAPCCRRRAPAAADSHARPRPIQGRFETQLRRSASRERDVIVPLAASAWRRRVAPSPCEVGRWGPVSIGPWSPCTLALLPNGKVLAYDSLGDNATADLSIPQLHASHLWTRVAGLHASATYHRLQHLLQRPRPSDRRDLCSLPGCKNGRCSSTASARRTSSTRPPTLDRGRGHVRWLAGTPASLLCATARC